MTLVSKSFSEIVTFSRSSNATRVGPTGVLEYAPHNLLVRSQEFDNASWTKGNSSVSANSAAAPDGTVTADKLVENTSASTHQCYQATTLTAQVHTLSFYAKAAGRSWVFANWAASGNLGAYFNLSAGTIGTVDSGYSATIQSVGNGWYRCSVTKLTTAAVWYAELDMATADGVFIYTGDGTSGIYLWGAQLSVGPYALDYTPTTTAAVYGPRFDYDPVTLAARGLLVEESRTNLVTYSEQFDNVAWIKLNASVTANAATSPDGTVSADLLIPDTSSNQHGVYQSLGATAGTPYTQSVFAKAAGYNWLFMTEGNNVTASASFNLATGVVGTVAGTGSPSATITALGNGWYRCTLTYTPIATSQNIQVRAANADAGPTFAGNGTSGIYIWGAQLEANASFASSYIPTLASTVTRSADVASVNTLSPWYNSSESTLFADFDISGPSGVFGGYVAQLAVTALSNNGILIYNNSVGLGTSAYIDASSVSLGNNTANVPAKIAIAYNGSSNGAVRNGGSVSSVGTTISGAATRLSLGSEYGGSYVMNGHLRRVAFFPRRLSNAEIQALTS